MTTYAINFKDQLGNTWKMDWLPTTSDNRPLDENDVQAVCAYIKYGMWPVKATSKAKECYKNLVNEIAGQIVYDGMPIERFISIVNGISHAYQFNKLSNKGKTLYERLMALADNDGIGFFKGRYRKLLKNIIETDHLFMIKFEEDEWEMDVQEEFKCCLCGTKITDMTSHNPFPVRPESWYGEKKNRCCKKCNNRIILPIRMRYGRNNYQHHERYMKMNYEELLKYAPDMGLSF